MNKERINVDVSKPELKCSSIKYCLEVDSDGVITKIDKTLDHYSMDDVIGQSVYHFIPEYEHENVRALHKKIFNTGESQVYDIYAEGVNRDFSSFYRTLNTPIYDGGKVSRIFSVAYDVTDHVDNIESIDKTLFQLKEAQRVGNIGSWEWDIKSGKDVWSNEFFHICGYSIGQVTPSYDNFFRLIHQDDQAKVKEGQLQCFETLEPLNSEFRLVTANTKELRWVHSIGEFICDVAGNPIGMIGTLQDITEKKKNEVALRENEKMLNSAQHVAKMGCWEWNIVEDKVVWSEPLYSLYGVDKASFNPSFEGFMGLVVPEDRGYVQSYLTSAMEERSPLDFQHSILRPCDGREVIVHCIGELVCDKDGVPEKMFGIAQDITERIQTEQVLEEQNQNLLEAANVFIFGVDRDGVITEWNRKMVDVLGYSKESMIGKDIRLDLASKDRDNVVESLDKLNILLNVVDSDLGPYELVFNTAKKTQVVLLLNVTQKKNVDGLMDGLYVVGHDITEHQKAEKEVHRKDILLKEVHHRVKNNLQIMGSLFNLKLNSLGHQESLVSELKPFQDRVHSLSLIHECLYQSSGEEVCFHDYIKTFISYLMDSYGLEDKSIKIDIDIQPQITFSVDLTHNLGLIVNELVTNAIQHAFKGSGKILISLNYDDTNNYCLSVSDDGVGLPEDINFGTAQTFGCRIVHLLVDQIDAELTINVNSGTTLRLLFQV